MVYKNNKKISSKDLNEPVAFFAKQFCKRCKNYNVRLYDGLCEDCLREQGKWAEGTK